MNDNALYFPYIAVPNERWTIKTLLYWDKLSSIVPMAFVDRPEKLGSFMRDLVEVGLVEQVIPSRYIQNTEEFERLFIELVESHLNKRPIHMDARENERAHVRTRIHVEKMWGIPKYLVDRGLAEQVDYSWYNVDVRFANLFMAYLASCLGGNSELNAVPVTNDLAFASMFVGDAPRRAVSRDVHRHKARQVVLDALLPFPNEVVTLEKLVQFKLRKGHLLPALRRLVESKCAFIAGLETASLREMATRQAIEDCRQQVDEIVDAMRPSWGKISFGSLVPLFLGGMSFTSADISTPGGLTVAGLTFAVSAYQAITGVQGLTHVQERRPLAYVAHAHSKFRLKYTE
ncbi:MULTISPECIES: hypothetical protein [Paraburkholderia]|uniref:hypothetical protein n=1 Tax=Paraburkholderia TaxID=1822464 RepID=UPI00036E718A|nr:MULTISPECIES: hypothetical protein [Paraburkholderia]MDH6149442.1 hypothetical protein [Paraburkholderia sp. WSM4179]